MAKRKSAIEIKKIEKNIFLKHEFEDLINSDPDFNYSIKEFKEWIIDLVLPFVTSSTT